MSSRLTNKAFNLLKEEVERSTKGIIAGEVQKEIILKRLDKLTTQKGTRITVKQSLMYNKQTNWSIQQLVLPI